MSRCLLGVPCRYDGASKGNAAVAEFLRASGCRVLDVCPECDCGLPCPRPPMTVRDTGGRLMLTDVVGGEHAGEMNGWIARELSRLADVDVAGFMLKSRSPSCGTGDVLIEGRDVPGDGLFAAAVRKAFPEVPVVSEKSLPGGFSAPGWEELRRKVESCVRGLLAHTPACHDWDHTLRVLDNARRILEELKATSPEAAVDGRVVETAALMHDIGRLRELTDRGQTDHAVYGAALAARWLRAIGVQDDEFIAHVSDCIRSHRYRKREGCEPPVSQEARIVYDADKLDSIGAIGIGRSFHFAGRCGARVHNRASEALGGESYGREDSAYREYLVKLRNIRGKMLTEPGRRLAEERHRFMEMFFQELNMECGMDDESGEAGVREAKSVDEQPAAENGI